MTFANEILSSSEEVILDQDLYIMKKISPYLKRFVLKIVTKVSNVILKMNLTDTHNGLKAFKLDSLNKIFRQVTMPLK